MEDVSSAGGVDAIDNEAGSLVEVSIGLEQAAGGAEGDADGTTTGRKIY